MFKKLLLGSAAALAIATAMFAFTGTTSATDSARVRVIHASPDAPNVDVYANGQRILSNVPYRGASGYLSVPEGRYRIKVFVAGANPRHDSPVINTRVKLKGGTDYTVAAVGKVADIRAAVFVDDNAAPADGNAHVRVIHASPEAPAVDIAVTGGPVLVPNLTFPNQAGPLPVPAGAYDLEVRLAGTTTVALPLPGVVLEEGKIYTFVAVGLLSGPPALEVLPLVTEPLAPNAACTADLNHDGRVDFQDARRLLRALLSGSNDAEYDVNQDARVNARDFWALVHSLGARC